MASHLIPPINVFEALKEIFTWAWMIIKLIIITLGWKGCLLLGFVILLPIIIKKIIKKIKT